jgi:hypothetical protein
VAALCGWLKVLLLGPDPSKLPTGPNAPAVAGTASRVPATNKAVAILRIPYPVAQYGPGLSGPQLTTLPH